MRRADPSTQRGMMRRKLCFVLPSLNGGGAERAAVQILNGLDDSRWDRSMFLFAREGPYLSDLDPRIAIHSADTPSRWGRWHALRSHVADARPEFVMAFLSFFTTLTATRAANSGARVIFNLQTPMSDFLTDADYQWRRGGHKAAFSAVTRLAYGAADLIVATSSGVARDLTASFGIDPSQIRVLANPVDLDRVRGAASEPIDADLIPGGDGPLIVAAGRLAEAKNYPLMIDAFVEVRKQLPARLCILGQGELEATLRSLVATRRLEGAVSFAGFQSNPWKYIARADLFLLTSKYEGFGNVLIEAMACGVPVVATASAGTRDIVRHGVDGMLVEAHTPSMVASQVINVLASPERRARLAHAAEAGANRFAADRVIARYESALAGVA